MSNENRRLSIKRIIRKRKANSIYEFYGIKTGIFDEEFDQIMFNVIEMIVKDRDGDGDIDIDDIEILLTDTRLLMKFTKSIVMGLFTIKSLSKKYIKNNLQKLISAYMLYLVSVLIPRRLNKRWEHDEIETIVDIFVTINDTFELNSQRLIKSIFHKVKSKINGLDKKSKCCLEYIDVDVIYALMDSNNIKLACDFLDYES